MIADNDNESLSSVSETVEMNFIMIADSDNGCGLYHA